MSIAGLGFAGDQMTIKKRLARNTLLPSGLAIYASPENILKYEEIRKVKSRYINNFEFCMINMCT